MDIRRISNVSSLLQARSAVRSHRITQELIHLALEVSQDGTAFLGNLFDCPHGMEVPYIQSESLVSTYSHCLLSLCQLATVKSLVQSSQCTSHRYWKVAPESPPNSVVLQVECVKFL